MNSPLSASKASKCRNIHHATRERFSQHFTTECYAVVTTDGSVIASYHSKSEALKFKLRVAAGCNVRIKKTEHRITVPGQSATATRNALAFKDSTRMLKPGDFTL